MKSIAQVCKANSASREDHPYGAMTMEEIARQKVPTSALISCTETADYLGISTRTLRYRQAQGLMPRRWQQGRKLMYRRSDIEALGLVDNGPDCGRQPR